MIVRGLGCAFLCLSVCHPTLTTAGGSSPGIADSGASSFTEYLLPYAGLVALAFALASGAFASLVPLS